MGIYGIEDSVTYQAVVVKGAVTARQDDLLRLGRRNLGNPSNATEIALRGIADPERLSRMMDALQDAASWDALLATP